eukprot:SM000220S07045  [mRNA]  locus=s220:74830:79189:+ [translate_table: standard]
MSTPEQLVLELIKREAFPDLAPILWHSCGTIAALLQVRFSPSSGVGQAVARAPPLAGLAAVPTRCGRARLQEIVSIYPMLSPPTLTAGASNRCVASHPDTRALFLNAHIPLYLYPFLNTVSKTRPFEYLRLTSLGVIGALVKVDDTDVINFLLSTEIIPLCLRTMELGSELSKTVATFIVQKILLDDVGLAYICATAERFFAVGAVLASMVAMLAEQPSVRLLKHIIRCYLRLSDNPRYTISLLPLCAHTHIRLAHDWQTHQGSLLRCPEEQSVAMWPCHRAGEALRHCLPELLRDSTFSACLRDDVTTRRWLMQLLANVGPSPHSSQRAHTSHVQLTVGEVWIDSNEFLKQNS